MLICFTILGVAIGLVTTPRASLALGEGFANCLRFINLLMMGLR
jgi:hypothetical protein